MDDQSLVSLEDVDLFGNAAMKMTSATSNLFYENKRKSFQTSNLRVSLEPESSNSDTSSKLRQERKLASASFERNGAVSVKFDLILFNFLYNYDFAKLIDHALNLRKTVHQMYNYKKVVN